MMPVEGLTRLCQIDRIRKNSQNDGAPLGFIRLQHQRKR